MYAFPAIVLGKIAVTGKLIQMQHEQQTEDSDQSAPTLKGTIIAMIVFAGVFGYAGYTGFEFPEDVIRLGFVSRRFPDYVPQTTSSISISLPERN